MQNIKKKLNTFIISFMFIFVGAFFFNTSQVHAGLDDSLLWGVTANFNANSFEGYVVANTDGKYAEKFHSMFYGTESVPLDKLRKAKTGTDVLTNSVSNLGVYNTLKMIDPKGSITLSDKANEAVNKIANGSTINEFAAEWQKGLTAYSNTKDYTYDIGNKWVNSKSPDYRKINAVYTWPGPNNAGNVTSAEQKYASTLSSTLINNLNSSIGTILDTNKCNLGKVSSSASQKSLFLDFAASLAFNANKNNEKETLYSYNVCNVGKNSNNGINVTYKIKQLTNDEFKALGFNELNGLSNEDTIKITTIKTDGSNGDSVIAIKGYPKGYGKDQDLYPILTSRAGTDVFDGEYTTKLDWSHVVYQAAFNYYNTGIDATGASDFYETDDGFIGTIIAKLIDGTLSNLSNLAGLYSLEDLCLNTGSRGISYWEGLFPSTWFSSAQYFYLFTFTLSVLMLLIALVRLAGQKAASSVGNVAKRISLLDGIKRIIISASLVMLFVPIFTVLVKMNSLIVETLTTLIPEGNSLDFSASSMSGLGLAGAFISIMLFFVSIKMNFTYILRGVTVLFCYILAPLAIMSNAMGDKYSQLTSNWLKELIGNIFIQSIHALIMMVYITIAGTSGVVGIEKMVIIYSFIPLTEFVRTNIFSLGKGLDAVADNLSAAANAGLGAVAAGGLEKVSSGLSSKFSGKAGSHSGGLSLNNTKGNSFDSADSFEKGKVGFGKSVSAGVGRTLSHVARGTAMAGVGALKLGAGIGGALGSGASNSQGRVDINSMRGLVGSIGGAYDGVSSGIKHSIGSMMEDHKYNQDYDNAMDNAMDNSRVFSDSGNSNSKNSRQSFYNQNGISDISTDADGNCVMTYNKDASEYFNSPDVAMQAGYSDKTGTYSFNNEGLATKTFKRGMGPKLTNLGKDKDGNKRVGINGTRYITDSSSEKVASSLRSQNELQRVKNDTIYKQNASANARYEKSR